MPTDRSTTAARSRARDPRDPRSKRLVPQAVCISDDQQRVNPATLIY
jgi:hypothetical protein